MRAAALLLPLTFVVVTACGGDDDDAGGDGATDTASEATSDTTIAGSPAPSAATECASAEGDPGRTVVLRVDDVDDGSGSLGSRTPSDLAAGPVRLSVEADAGNGAAVDVVVAGPDGFTTTIAGVEPGVTCGVDVDLAAGDYVVTSSGNPDADTDFAVVP